MLESLIDEAFEYAYPLFAVAETRHRAMRAGANQGRLEPNTLQHERHLSDHTAQWITAPNNDTLYSNAWLDLSGGPVRLQVAEMPPGRYWSVALLDAFTNNFAVLGQRLDGCGSVDVTLLGPEAPGVGDARRVIRAPGNDVWLFARCLVEGPADLPNAHAMQSRIVLQAPAVHAPAAWVVPGQSTDPRNFLAVVNASLARNPVPAGERELLGRFAEVGLLPGAADAWDAIGAEGRAAWSVRIAGAHDRLRDASAKGRRLVQGWYASAPEMGNFGTNRALRASVALGGLGALPPDEAMYFVRFHDDATTLLHGRHRYSLQVPPGGIPTDSFWSFSMYAPTADSRRFFVDNPIGRYSIGNRTPGLVSHADGSLDIALQHDPPTDERLLRNWLPAPAGPFQIALRAYLPGAELRGTVLKMPRITRI